MSTKQQILTTLREEYDRWEALLARLSEAQITAPQLYANMSIKDVIAHLWAWQQRSIARMQAALHNTEPTFPQWLPGIDPDAHENTDRTNAWIYDTYRDLSWSQVHQNWKDGFQRLIDLGEAFAEKDLLEAGKYQWLAGHPLILVLESSYEHHHIDHFEPLLTWLRQNDPAAGF